MTILLDFLRKSKYFVFIFAMGMLAWFVTWRWSQHFTPAWPWIAGTVVLAVIGVVIFEIVRRHHEKKMAAGLESGLSASEGDKIDLKGEIKALRENWSNSVEKLKSTDAGVGRTALYRLPWYMIIGEPASGKSTLLRKSGLDFPIGDAAVRGLHGTRNCDWWFANEAVFLDTAGRYIIETQDQEWIAFLGLLAKYRKKKPISGVLVAIAANSLLTKSHEDLLQDGKRIRNRIDELIDVLGINFPVYVLVTKVDLISGFVEFFSPLDERYRDQMLGWTLPVETEAHFDGENFDRQFTEVTEHLYRMRPWLESKVGKRELGKTFLFPEEFSYVGSPLRTVLDVVFKTNVYQETPVCRGVYFSSGTQVGSPLARALEDMAKDLHIPSDFGFGIGMEEEKEVRTYFIKDLVSAQVLADREMTWRTGRAETRAKKRRMGWGMMGIGISMFLGLFASSSFFANRSRLTDFKSKLPPNGRPLEVAMGTLEAEEKARPPGFLDIGLNYSDEVIPTLAKSFRRVSQTGLIQPCLAALETEIEKEGPDIHATETTWGHYVYLRRGIEGKLPEQIDAAKEEPHLEALMSILRERDLVGERQSTDLRTALFRFGANHGLEDLPEYDREQLKNRMKAVEQAYENRSGAWLGKVEAFVNERRTSGGELKRNFDAAIAGVKEICARVRIRPHDSVDTLMSIASEIRAKASGLEEQEAGQTPITALAPSEESLVKTLTALKENAPAGSDLAARAEEALKPFAKSEISNTDDPRKKALFTLVSEVDKSMEEGPEAPKWPERPTEDELARRRTEIAGEIESVGKETWSRIESAVAAIETEPLTEEKKDGDKVKKVHRPGWYDTITLLAQARRADQREGDYEQHGLKPWLDLGRWRKQQPGDAEADVFSARQFGEVMLPRLRKQAEFFEIGDENGLVARDIAAAAQADIHRAVDTWLTEADEYWQRQFTSSLPAPARTLAQVRTRLDELKGIRPSLLMSTMKNIQGAFSGLKKLTDDPKSDVVLAASEERRKQLYDKWSVCFDIQDLSVYTIHRAIADLSDFSQAIDLVVSSLGTDTAQARARVAKISKGGTNVLSQASEVANRLDAGAAADSPRSALAKQVRAITDAAWSGLLEAAEKNVNDRWSNVRVTLSGGGSFKAAFGAGGPFDTFKKEYLSDLFNEDDLQTRARILGQTLAITTEMRQTLNQVKKLRNGLFDSSGSYRSDHVALDLQLGGAANPESLVVEYQPKEGQTQTSQKYVNGRPITFQFDWSPLTCKEFRFTVGFVNSEPKTHKWTGPWAVADALRAARQESNAYVWPAKEGEWKNDAGQPYEVKLTLLPDSTTALLEFYPGGGDKSPIDALIQSLPAKAVKVEK